MTDRPPVVAAAHGVLERHARTFSAAAALLAPDTRDEIATLYAFCRTVDDLADDGADRAGLDRVVDELDGHEPPSPLVAAMLALPVPVSAARQLVDGVRSDLGEVRLPDVDALIRYAYQVAGTVGLMVCPLLGVVDPVAWPFAIDLGVGMQLSNIARDVGEDAGRGRVYLPATWLA
ncbi:MAG: squalene/phytoene synthase family protein, partial [Myxococcota bacterium]